MQTTNDLFQPEHTLAWELLEKTVLPYQALDGIHGMILEIGARLPRDEYEEVAPHVWIARDAKVCASAFLGEYTVIGHETEVRHCAFIRENALVGDHCVVGNSTELKNVILFDCVQVPHFNYVGDSILGYKSHMGAGAVTSNIKSDGSPIILKDANGERYETGRIKIGTMLGEYVEVGCNSVLNPGTVIGCHSTVYPTSCVRGEVPPYTIWKNNGQMIHKH